MHHGAGLRTLTGSLELSRALALDPGAADVSEADAAMLEYSVTLTRAPSTVSPANIDHLRSVGFDDRGILDICQVVSYYNYVNRLADGLGVELEDFWTTDEMIISREEFDAMRARRDGQR